MIATSKRLYFDRQILVTLLGIAFLVCLGSQPVYASSAKEDPAALEAPFYLEMKPISVPIRKRSGNIRYYMFLTFSLEFDENDKKTHARKVMPRLRDAFLQDMSGRSVLHKDKSRGLDYEKIKKRLLKQATKVLHGDAPIGLNIIRIQKGA